MYAMTFAGLAVTTWFSLVVFLPCKCLDIYMDILRVRLLFVYHI